MNATPVAPMMATETTPEFGVVLVPQMPVGSAVGLPTPEPPVPQKVGERKPEPEPEPEPQVADNVVAFPSKSRRGRPRKSGDDYRVSVEQVSKHTYAVRLRWTRTDGSEDGMVVNRLRDDIVKEIKRSKKRYEQFKTQTIANWKSRTVRQSHGA